MRRRSGPSRSSWRRSAKRTGRLSVAALGAVTGLALCTRPAWAVCTATQLDVSLLGTRRLRPVVSASLNGMPAALIFDTGGSANYTNKDAVARFGLSAAGQVVTFRSFGQVVTAPLVHARELKVGSLAPTPADFLAASDDPRFDGTLGWPSVSSFDVMLDLAAGRITLLDDMGGCRAEASLDWLSQPAASVLELEAGDVRPIGRVRINGVELRMLFDTGTPDSSLTEDAARRTGVRSDTEGVEPAGSSGGLGAGGLLTWIGAFRRLEIGRETISDVRLPFMRKPNASADMILGADFFRTHRVLISRRRRRIYMLPVDGGGFLRSQRP